MGIAMISVVLVTADMATAATTNRNSDDGVENDNTSA